MSFGKPIMEIREPRSAKSKSPKVREHFSYRDITVKGAWRLWIFCAYWKITLRDSSITTTSSSSRRKAVAMRKLDGQKLVNVSINVQTGATCFEFDLGASLNVRRYNRSRDEELWLLYKPNGYVLTVRGDGLYHHAPGSTTPDKEKWHNIDKWVNKSKDLTAPSLMFLIGTPHTVD